MIRERPETAKITSGVWLHLLYSSRVPETSEKKQKLAWPRSSRPSLLVCVARSCCFWIAVWREGMPAHLSGARNEERQVVLGSYAPSDDLTMALFSPTGPHIPKVPLLLISATDAEWSSPLGDVPDFLDQKYYTTRESQTNT